MPPTSQAQNPAYKYQVGGSLQIDAPSYVERQADIDFYNALRAGEFCYVLNSRQMGKSSLRVRTMRKLQTDGIACGVIDLTAIGSQDITPAEWYLGVLRRLVRSFMPHVKALPWWSVRSDLSPVQRLGEFIESVLLLEVSQDIVIFVDEIDSVLKLNFKDDFFALLRACYNKRADTPAYQRLTFALLGVATPYDLMTDKNGTPFNIGRAIQLNGFQQHEALPLAQGLVERVINPQRSARQFDGSRYNGGNPRNALPSQRREPPHATGSGGGSGCALPRAQLVLQEILAWTGGQPFLTQKLCQLVLTFGSPIPAGGEAEYVEKLVHSKVIENWESQDEPEHLKTIRDRVLRSELHTRRQLRLYQQILLRGEITADNSPEQMELRLSGMVVKQQGVLRVSNRIYESVFNQGWIDKALSDLRPYASALAAWVASNYQDESYLLRGQALRDAQVWAEGRSLSDRDHQFLAASLELDKRELQMAWSAERKLHQILPGKHLYKRVLLLSMAVTAAIVGLRYLGILQPLELEAFDQMLRLRPLEAPDPRLLVVAITEDDFRLPVQKHRKGSLSERALALLLQKLESYQPQAIGLDVYHDYPFDPNQPNLVNKIRHSHNFIAVCKVSEPKVNEPGIAPPPEIPPERQGFSDSVLDPDGILRRQLIAMKLGPTSSCTTPYALNAQLAFNYLEAKGIPAKYNQAGDLQIGRVVFKRWRSHMGGYQQLDDRGYQVLLNYCACKSPVDIAETVTLKDVLTGAIKPETVKNRIVLVGVTAQSASDFIATPYSTGQGSYQQTPGVMLHAQMVSQMLKAVLDGRSLLWVWPAWGDVLWVWSWSLLGGILVWRIRHPLGLALTGAAALGVLYGVSFGLLIHGGWIPLVPTALAFVITGGSTVLITSYLLEHKVPRSKDA